MTKINKKLGLRIQELRKAKGLTQAQLAEVINVEVVTISRIENGTRFPLKENLENIAQALNVQVKDLFDYEHLRTKTALLKDIQAMSKQADLEDLRYIYKLLKIYFEAK